MQKLSIRFDVLLATLIALLFFITTLCLTYFISHQTTERLKEEVGTTLSATAYQLSDKLDHYMWSRTAEVNLLGTLPTIKQSDDVTVTRTTLEQLQQQIPDFSWIGLLDAEGTVRASTKQILEGQSIQSRPVFQQAKEHPFIGDVHDALLLSKLLPNPSNEPLQFVDISTPLFTDGQLTGILAAHLSFTWAKEIEQSFKSSTEQIDGLEFFIVSEKQRTVLLGPDNWRGKQLPPEYMADGYKVAQWPDGETYLTGSTKSQGYKNYDGLGWTILVRQPSEVAFKDAILLKQYIFFAGLIASFVTAIIGWFIAKLMTQPLQKITFAAEQMQHDRSITIPPHTGIREITVLSVALRQLISQLSHTEQERTTYESLALIDPLTGLPNRNGLTDYLQMISSDDAPEVYFYLDLDGFKAINDQFGHQTGDLVLKEVAARLHQLKRPNSIVTRLGGDEFLIVLNDVLAFDRLEQYGEDLIALLSRPYLIDRIPLHIGASIGIAIRFPDETVEQVIHRADIALYDSKKQGKGRLTFNG
ncbi:diguanylate cyclase [Exiguobacterium sp. s193]|uniref:sensor domain-containing diguanylate cyclase n=1 Tax=Exiguobacterium sp. s193 TaxID=2751207 RepID=UPI001BE73B3D|nr:diguanylate cyclase [Exiguobacterium sp. s193]